MKQLIVYASETCPMKAACDVLEGKWKMPMLYVLCVNGTLRYTELRSALGITNMTLSKTLRQMEDDGLVNRMQYNEIPPRVEYSLTALAMELIPVLEQFASWGNRVQQEVQKQAVQPSTDPMDPKE